MLLCLLDDLHLSTIGSILLSIRGRIFYLFIIAETIADMGSPRDTTPDEVVRCKMICTIIDKNQWAMSFVIRKVKYHTSILQTSDGTVFPRTRKWDDN